MGRVLINALPACAALAAGYQEMRTVFQCVSKFGIERGCLLGGYFWLTLAALLVLLWIVVQAVVGRWHERKGAGVNGPSGKGHGV